MIISAEIISQPYSGEFEEKIYDNDNPWNSQSWTWIKFTNEDYYEWCGQFRGFPRKVAVSDKLGDILVLTSDYLFRLKTKNAELTELENQPGFHNLTVTPEGEFILADYYHLEKIGYSFKDRLQIDSPIQMDMIEFKNWDGHRLNFTCDEFMNWDRHLEMELDTEDWEIRIKNAT